MSDTKLFAVGYDQDDEYQTWIESVSAERAAYDHCMERKDDVPVRYWVTPLKESDTASILAEALVCHLEEEENIGLVGEETWMDWDDPPARVINRPALVATIAEAIRCYCKTQRPAEPIDGPDGASLAQWVEIPETQLLSDAQEVK